MQIKKQTLQEYAERVSQEAQMKILKEIEKTTKEIAEEQNIDIVLAGGILFVDEKIDITKEVVSRMNKKYAAKKKKEMKPKVTTK